MEKSEYIVRYTAEELRAMRERGEVHQPAWAYIDSLTEEEGEIGWETAINRHSLSRDAVCLSHR